jgi:LPS-assembly protein
LPRSIRPTLFRLAIAAGFASTSPAHADASPAGEASCPQMDFGLAAPQIELDFDRIQLEADRAELSEEGLSKLIGGVRLRQGDRVIKAEALDFDEREKRVHIGSESVFRDSRLLVRSQTSDFDLDDRTGTFSGTEFIVPERAARGRARKLEVLGEGRAQLEGVSYTTCSPGSRGWLLRASSIKLDQEEGMGTARNARLRFLGVPIFYAPWFRFPIDDRRRSGLLFPVIGDSDRTGFDLQVPLYLNLAPNYDATLTPRVMSERGTQINTGLRYLMRRSEGRARYEYLSEDRQTGERRDYLNYTHHGLINRRTGLEILYGATSDQSYFEDFGGRLDLSAITHLERSARLTYQAPAAYSIQGLVQDFQALSPTVSLIDKPYRRLPQLLVNAETGNDFFKARLGFAGEYVNFARDDSVQGQRLNLHPYLRWEHEASAWFARSELEYDYTGYGLEDASAGQDTRPDRSLPSFSAETGLRFERLVDSGAQQLLEPRVFYLYTPFEEQADLPNFDSGEPDFEFSQLFAHNRFLGRDRISDANQVAIAATLRELDPDTGVTRFSASVGQLFRLTDPEVTLPGGSAPDAGATDFIASLDYRISRYWKTALASQWSPQEADFNRSSVRVSYHGPRRQLEVGYRYRDEVLEQTDLVFATPLIDGWSLAGRWRYSLQDGQSLDTQAGLEYDTCCWALRSSFRRYIATAAGEYSNGIYLQLEFKGLARVGSGTGS